MKNLSLKMDDTVFNETEKITAKINKNSNRYRRIISNQLKKESKLVQEESMKVLTEFEKLKRHSDSSNPFV